MWHCNHVFNRIHLKSLISHPRWASLVPALATLYLRHLASSSASRVLNTLAIFMLIPCFLVIWQRNKTTRTRKNYRLLPDSNIGFTFSTVSCENGSERLILSD